MKIFLAMIAIVFASSAFAKFDVQFPTEVKVQRPSNSTELLQLGDLVKAQTNSTWETTTGTQTCPDGTSASDSCQWLNPGGGATCDGGCNPNAWESCHCW